MMSSKLKTQSRSFDKYLNVFNVKQDNIDNEAKNVVLSLLSRHLLNNLVSVV